jgi:hypothetical protein
MVAYFECKSAEEAIDKCKLFLIEHNSYGIGMEYRSWLEYDAKEKGDFAVKVLFLEGTPIKAMIVCNYGRGYTQLFDLDGKLLCKCRTLPEEF